MDEEKTIWVITDMHLMSDGDDSSVIKHCHRPKNFTELIVKNWVDHVKETDTIISLGDEFLPSKYRTEECSKLIKALPGIKLMTRGNHSTLSEKKYYDMGFELVAENLTIRNIFLNHYPTESPDKNIISLFGHSHSDFSATKEEKLKKTYPFTHKRSIMLSIESVNFMPVPLFDYVQNPRKFTF